MWQEGVVEFPHLHDIERITNWKDPVKQIYNLHDVQNFQKSVALQYIQKSLFKICSLISNKNVPSGVLDDNLVSFEPPSQKRQDLAPPSDTVGPVLSDDVKSILGLMKEFDDLIQQYPPLPGPRRYGNMACRSWHDQLKLTIDTLLAKYVKPFYQYGNYDGFVMELKHYILNSFGSRQRLDYGTGHELSFLAFVNALIMCGVLNENTISGEDLLIIFAKYYDLMKKMILTYTLEPAGSHGVWGLDDHFHLVYILGSCQFIKFGDHEEGATHHMVPSPSSVLKPITLQKYRCSNLYFNAISFVRKVKTGPFNEHSPILYDVSAVKTWKKVNQGMIKMWFVEVLSKFPVVQHFYFGNVLYPWRDANGVELPRSAEFSSEKLEEDLVHYDINKPTMGHHDRRNVTGQQVNDTVVTKAPWAK